MTTQRQLLLCIITWLNLTVTTTLLVMDKINTYFDVESSWHVTELFDMQSADTSTAKAAKNNFVATMEVSYMTKTY